MLDAALRLASHGFRVFPLRPGEKTPAIDEFEIRAASGPDRVRMFWVDPLLEIIQPYNAGISTRDLLVLDVDMKDGRDGEASLAQLLGLYGDLPGTYEQRTPTGGRHLVFSTGTPAQNSAGKLGSGLDVRGRGGFVVGAGSVTEKGEYTANWFPVAPAPAWLVQLAGKADLSVPLAGPGAPVASAWERAEHYVVHEALVGVEGSRNQQAYVVAAKCVEMGCTPEEVVVLLSTVWPCTPPLDEDEVRQVAGSAFKRNTQGVTAPEREFEDAPAVEEVAAGAPPSLTACIQRFNEEFAFCVAGGAARVLWEKVDEKGKRQVEHLGLEAFHSYTAPRKVSIEGGKPTPISRVWMGHRDRRTYEGIVFAPGENGDVRRFYNMWQGFAVKPLGLGETCSAQGEGAFQAYLEHMRENVCGGIERHFRWLMGYYAHLFQHPGEKVRTAIVLQGDKGTGKNIAVETIGKLLGQHFLLVANKRYLVGNFNSHLENCLFLVFDESFWAGEKNLDGILKDLITGEYHVIERKGHEPYKVRNYTRIAVLGNDDSVIPASHDERRYAVFHVGNGRRCDVPFFRSMLKGMKAGGHRWLLRYFLDYDLTGIDVDVAPITDALRMQKEESLTPWASWWRASLVAERILGGDFEDQWPEGRVEKQRVRQAFGRYCRDRNITARVPDETGLGRHLRRMCPAITNNEKVQIDGGKYTNAYGFPSLLRARAEWARYIGHEVTWDD